MDNSGVSAFKNWALTSQSKPPHDLLDTVYPNEVLDYWVPSYLLECITRGCNHHHLREQLRDMQYHVLNCYGIAAPSLYDLPHIEQMWKMLLPFPVRDHLYVPIPECLPALELANPSIPSSQWLSSMSQTHTPVPEPPAQSVRPDLVLQEIQYPTNTTPKTIGRKTKAGCDRFAAPLSENEIQGLAKAIVPKKTQQATHWAVRTFNAWVKQ